MSDKSRITPGSLIGQFKVIQCLGVGGMGQVFLAQDTATGENAAIKVLFKDDPSYEIWLKLFLREKEIYATIKHPNVVGYITSGETKDFNFLVLEHILGISMRTKLNREGPSGLITTFSWMQEITLALHAAHQKGYVHRDLKPDNIMITRDLDIRLIDFGIAKRLGRKTYEENGTKEPWVGTLCYSAPESIMAQAVTQRADIYAAGLLFYEILTGQCLVQNPFDKQIVLKEMKQYDNLGHVLPPIDDSPLYIEIDKLLYDMLRFAPIERIPSTGALLSRMETIAQTVGGSVLTLSRDESKQVAQREIADTHLWNALNFIGQSRVKKGLDELSSIGIFINALEPITKRMLITQLDLMVLNIKSTFSIHSEPYCVPYEKLVSSLNQIIELLSKLLSPIELYAREFILVKRMEQELDVDDYERFLQMQAVGRKQSYIFQSSYIRVLSNINKKISHEVWLRFIRDLISKKSLVHTKIEIEELRKTIGDDAIDLATLELHEELFSKQLFQEAEFDHLLNQLSQTNSSNHLMIVCERFLTNYPENLKAQHKLLSIYKEQKMEDEILEMEVTIGATHFQKRNYRGTEKVFIKIFKEHPSHEAAPVYLYACLIAKKQVPPSTSGQHPLELSDLRDYVARAYKISQE